MPDLKGQLAIVTGASSGLGEATAVRLVELGAPVALLARTKTDLDRVAARICDTGGAAFAVPVDLADPAAVVAAGRSSRNPAWCAAETLDRVGHSCTRAAPIVSVAWPLLSVAWPCGTGGRRGRSARHADEWRPADRQVQR